MKLGKLHSAFIFLTILVCRETLKSSHGYTGLGEATYPNGDKYKGSFKDGVSNRLLHDLKPFDLLIVSFSSSSEAETEITPMQQRAPKSLEISHTKVPGKTTFSATHF